MLKTRTQNQRCSTWHAKRLYSFEYSCNRNFVIDCNWTVLEVDKWQLEIYLSYFFSHWNQVQIIDFCNWQVPIIFFSAKSKSKHSLTWTLVYIPSKKLQAKKNLPLSKFLLNYLHSGSSSGVKLFIFNISAMNLFIFHI